MFRVAIASLRSIAFGIAVAYLVSSVAALVIFDSARATHSSPYQQISFDPDGDTVYNYDQTTQNNRTDATKVDWPIRFMFHRTIGFTDAWLKAQLNGDCGDIGASLAPDLCGTGLGLSDKYHWVRNSGIYEQDEDDGIKGEFWCQTDYHMRIYEGGHAQGDTGFYKLASVHNDHEPPYYFPFQCGKEYYSAEGEEGWWINRMNAGYPSWNVSDTQSHGVSYWYNYEPGHWRSNHWVQSNGYTTYVGMD